MIITNKLMNVATLPWWVILIIILVLLIVVVVLVPLIKWLADRKTVREPKKVEPVKREAVQKIEKDPKNSPYMGFNWFGKKQAIRTVKTVYVQEVEDPCPLCLPFENKVISLEEYGQNVTLMSEAISVGYHHLGCQHIDLDYFHEATKIPDFKWSLEHKQEQYQLRLEQYRFEEKIRNLKYQIDNEVKDASDQQKLVNQLKFQEEELNKFCETNNLKRNLERENYNVSELKKFS